MRRLLCWLGWHSWLYIIEDCEHWRECRHCKKAQFLEFLGDFK